MVTIEHKLSLFSSLLNRSINERFTSEMEALRKEYEDRIKKNKEQVDKETQEILKKASKKAEAEKTELLNKMKVDLKREYSLVRERCFDTLMDHLKEEIERFILSEEYEKYLLSLVNVIKENDQLSGTLHIYLTNRDYERYAEKIRNELLKSGQRDITVKIENEKMTGGIIAQDPDGNMRLNLSIDALLEDKRSYIMKLLFEALETGEENGI